MYSFFQWGQAVCKFNKNNTAFEKSYVFLKGNGRYLVSYAEFYYNANNKNKAFELMKEAENYYSDVAFLNNLAVLYEENGFIAEARKRYELATHIAPNDANIALARILFLQRIGEEESAYKLALFWKEKLTSNALRQKYKLASRKIDTIITNE